MVSADRISRTSPPGSSRHLPPFALWPALPTAVTGRDARDYYGGSVPVDLAVTRESRIPSRWYVRAHRRCPTHHLLERSRRPSRPARVRPTAWTSGVQGDPGLRRAAGGCAVPSSAVGVRAIQLSPYRAGLAGRCSTRLRAVPLSQHAPVPFAFRRRVSWVTRDRPSWSSCLRQRSNTG